MEDILFADDFLEQSKAGVMIDVRSPSEFIAGHIPGAVNLPLFSDAERAEIGTLYVHQGKDPAVERGLELVGPKMAGFVKQARRWSEGKPLFIYCWRGGMRSGSMAWLFRTAGLKTYLLSGGYKAYRNSLLQLLEKHSWKLVILGGPTGCGKTEILLHMQKAGHQVIDLEGMAHHKGSAFGALGEQEQPTTEHFANELHHCLRTFDPSQPVWCEGESSSIGKVFIPREFYLRMMSGLFINLELPLESRIQHIMKDYGQFSADDLIDSFYKIERRLGGDATKQAVEHVRQGDLESAICIALKYYDKGYGFSSRKQWAQQVDFNPQTCDVASIVTELEELYKKTINK